MFRRVGGKVIAGIGTDLVAVARLAALYRRHGQRARDHLLSEEEYDDFRRASDPGRFLAKRFAAKEALAKALGTGLIGPARLTHIAVAHDRLGRPFFVYAPVLAGLLERRALRAHLSLSDERDHALAFVILESMSSTPDGVHPEGVSR